MAEQSQNKCWQACAFANHRNVETFTFLLGATLHFFRFSFQCYHLTTLHLYSGYTQWGIGKKHFFGLKHLYRSAQALLVVSLCHTYRSWNAVLNCGHWLGNIHCVCLCRPDFCLTWMKRQCIISSWWLLVGFSIYMTQMFKTFKLKC